MWLLQAPPEWTPRDGIFFEHQMVNGCILVGTQYWWQYFIYRGFKDISPKEFPGAYRKPELLERVLHVSHGGIGDVLFTTAILEVYKKIFPQSEHSISTNARSADLLSNNPNIEKLLFDEERKDLHTVSQYDDAINYGCAVAGNADSTVMNVYDILFNWAGLPVVDSDKVPRIYLHENEILAFRNKLKNQYQVSKRDKIVTIQYESSTSIRNLEIEKFQEIGIMLSRQGFKVFFIGITPILQTDIRQCPNCDTRLLTAMSKQVPEVKRRCECDHEISIYLPEWPEGIYSTVGLSMREIATLISLSKYFIGIDSCGLHIAGAFQIPSLGIFSSFDGDLRLRYYPKARWIQKPFRCAPCFIHHIDCRWQLEQKLPVPPCMSQITVSEILSEFEKLKLGDYSKPESFQPQIPRMCPVCSSRERTFITRKGSIMYYDCVRCGTTYTGQPEYEVSNYNSPQYWEVYKVPAYRETLKTLARTIVQNFSNRFNYQGRLLDIGCGTGGIVDELNRLGWEAEGVEFSETGKKVGLNLGYNIEKTVTVGDFMTVDYEKKFDVVLFNHSLEHFTSPHQTLQKAINLLDQGGIIVIHVPVNSKWDKHNNKWGHINAFTPGEHSVIMNFQTLVSLLLEYGCKLLSKVDVENGDAVISTFEKIR